MFAVVFDGIVSKKLYYSYKWAIRYAYSIRSKHSEVVVYDLERDLGEEFQGCFWPEFDVFPGRKIMYASYVVPCGPYFWNHTIKYYLSQEVKIWKNGFVPGRALR